MWKSFQVEICELQKELLRIWFVFEVKSLRLELLVAPLASKTCAGKRLIGRRLAIFRYIFWPMFGMTQRESRPERASLESLDLVHHFGTRPRITCLSPWIFHDISRYMLKVSDSYSGCTMAFTQIQKSTRVFTQDLTELFIKWLQSRQ